MAVQIGYEAGVDREKDVSSVRGEWAANWPLPMVAMVGIAGGTTFSYAAGILAEPISKDLGWTRTEFYSALSLQLMAALVVVPLVGFLVDRVGSRRVAIGGCVSYMIGFSLLGTANGSLWQWWLLSLVMLLSACFITQPVWIRPIAAIFRKSRGLALAIALSGNGVAMAIWPLIAAYSVGSVGWRLTFPVLAGTWGIVALPLTFFFFFDRKQATPNSAELEGTDLPVSPIGPIPPIGEVLKSARFVLLTLSGALQSCAVFGLTIHFVPL